MEEMEERVYVICKLSALCGERWGAAADRDDDIRRPGEPEAMERSYWRLRLERAEALAKRVGEDPELSPFSEDERNLLWELVELAVELATNSRHLFKEVAGKEWTPRR